jgi:hypothetical protein
MTPIQVFDFIKANSVQGIGIISKLLANKVKDIYFYEKNNSIPDITIIILYLNSSVVKYN